MTSCMMATRNALLFNNPATLQYIHEKTETVSETTPANAVTSHEPRVSTRTKLSRKMKELFSNEDKRLNKTETPGKKSMFYRQFIKARALMNKSLHR
ncbi:hypothetical protein PHMEG_00030127 [Phytophthora megakarya]|uniref:Uncharacterized protein n=1 Tax=Phytophthora megakarya TaxID=4795 RepID=A0A225V150_9STRA|nr:hypothetical protein PHMEG_00030127 [Phytophthora megakarya]